MPTTHEVLYQSVIAFIVLFVVARVLGKRQVAQLSFFDYIVGITIGNIAASWSLDQVKTRHAVVSLLLWCGLSLLIALLQRKSYRARVFLDGRPTVVIQRGKILERNLKACNLSIEELMQMLREKDVFKVSDVEYAILEMNGKLSVMKKSEVQPLTPKDTGTAITPEHEPRLVIIDGHVMERSLRDAGFTREWLLEEVRKLGAQDFRDVFLAQVDSNGRVYADLYQDHPPRPEPKPKAMVAANLKKIQADLEMFAMETRNEEAKQTYTQMAQQVKALLDRAAPHLKD
ncbi:DUF421 domain-containing protein [Alicyclobacillus macrosporangiidus]|uniref:Uncharacterized membrane protein YcaP, DUF421 family n=1 Tax=Alicyclobacillus macrosporangiidus TaxID=392015 RepID=A0A1I7K6N3_9BACL|nr:DUF421 domain-containing protein [Alicyclobacillus macrosporangiidus]SFU93071.1 Uncharacterized membrane protein YcaP, DUF421 family [Alicyclobacillus macrosporangiidus]